MDCAERGRPGQPGHLLGKNPGDVWWLFNGRLSGVRHFATFPEHLVYRPLLATCPEAVCTRCGQAWRRQATIPAGPADRADWCRTSSLRRYPERAGSPTESQDRWMAAIAAPIPDRESCSIRSSVPALSGWWPSSWGGTWIGIELNPEYARAGYDAQSRQPERG